MLFYHHLSEQRYQVLGPADSDCFAGFAHSPFEAQFDNVSPQTASPMTTSEGLEKALRLPPSDMGSFGEH